MQVEKERAINCQGNLMGPDALKMGCWMFPSGEERFSRQMIDTIEGVPGAQPRDVRIAEPPQIDQLKDGQTSRSAMSSNYSKVEKDLYFKPVLDSDRRQATGVIMNSHTGKMYECFEEDLPPPNANHEIPEYQLKQTNPRLIYAQGGRDPLC